MTNDHSRLDHPYSTDYGSGSGDTVSIEPGPRAPSTDILTPREASVLALIIQGSTNREAARVLDISPRTVEFHRANIMQKFGAKNVADLMRMVLYRR